jgi:hypothetical protein
MARKPLIYRHVYFQTLEVGSDFFPNWMELTRPGNGMKPQPIAAASKDLQWRIRATVILANTRKRRPQAAKTPEAAGRRHRKPTVR